MSRSNVVPLVLSSRKERTLVRRAVKGDRQAFLDLFLANFSLLDRFVRHEVRYAEQIGGVDKGRIDPCAIVDQVYIAGLHSLDGKSLPIPFVDWLRYLALHIIRQQIRSERKSDADGLRLERGLRPRGNTDTEFWDFYQPDEVIAIEDLIGDASSDPAQQVERSETAAEIERQIAALPPDLARLLRLRLFEGLHASEIAAMTDQTLDAVRESLRLACQTVRQAMQET